jgi:phage-related protein
MGAEPVRDWIKSLSADDRKVIGADIQTVEFGWPIGMPLCKSLGGGLWEVRSNITDGRNLIIVNGFVKKTRKTPEAEIELARKRKKETES